MASQPLRNRTKGRRMSYWISPSLHTLPWSVCKYISHGIFWNEVDNFALLQPVQYGFQAWTWFKVETLKSPQDYEIDVSCSPEDKELLCTCEAASFKGEQPTNLKMQYRKHWHLNWGCKCIQNNTVQWCHLSSCKPWLGLFNVFIYLSISFEIKVYVSKQKVSSWQALNFPSGSKD